MATGLQLRKAGILTAALAVAFAAEPAAASPVAACDVQSTATEAALAAKLVELVNAHRRAHGLRALRVAPALERAAVWKARQMARDGYMSHRTLEQRLRTCGFAGRGWGEALAAGQRRALSVVRNWLSSPSHRAVLEAPWWRVAGAGVARARDGVGRFWVIDFGA